MEWIKVKINTSKPGLDFVAAIFEDCGVESLEIEDNEEFLQVLESTRHQWNYVEDELYQEKIKACSVAAYLANNKSGKDTLESIENKINQAKRHDINKIYGSLEIFIAMLNEEDWAENWKKYFKPIPVGENILICPEWEEVPPEYKSRVIFKIDPGMCFGTGTHETTRLCAAALEKYIKPGGLILDLGCGSGILFIIALLLGAGFADAVDIDENSVRIAKNNAQANNIDARNYKVYAGDLLAGSLFPGGYYIEKDCDFPGGYYISGDYYIRDGDKLAGAEASPVNFRNLRRQYDIILINIVPDVIVKLLPVIAEKNLLAENGVCILSGIIGKYMPDIESACESYGFKIIDETSENDWQCAVIKKLGEA